MNIGGSWKFVKNEDSNELELHYKYVDKFRAVCSIIKNPKLMIMPADEKEKGKYKIYKLNSRQNKKLRNQSYRNMTNISGIPIYAELTPWKRDCKIWLGTKYIEQPESQQNELEKGMKCSIFEKLKSLDLSMIEIQRIESIHSLQYVLGKDKLVLITFPIFQYSCTPWLVTMNGENHPFIGGSTMIVYGYDNHGFYIFNDWSYEKNIYYPYEQWGAHWEVLIYREGQKYRKMIKMFNQNKTQKIVL